MDSNLQTALILIVIGILVFGGGGQPPRTAIDATPSEVTLLARLIEAEAGGEPYRGKVAVGAVVVNRLRDSRFPNTIRDVIYEPGQFAVSAMNRPPSEESIRAARAALSGEDPTNGALFFYNPRTARLDPWWQTRTRLTQIGNHVFLR